MGGKGGRKRWKGEYTQERGGVTVIVVMVVVVVVVVVVVG